MARVGRPPSCTCEDCPKCERRRKGRERYQRLSRDERRAQVTARDQEAVRRADAARHKRDRAKRLKAMKEYAATPEGRAAHAEARRRWAERNAEKRKAHVAVGNAVRDGRLTKGPCEDAGEDCAGRIEAHHDDYAKPLEVRWLCRAHHGAVHQHG